MNSMNTSTPSFANVPVAVLCGGRAVTMGHSSAGPLNKALVQVHGKPMLWWVLCQYVRFGARNFILATGFQSEAFASVLQSLGARTSPDDASLYQMPVQGHDCQLRMVDTGLSSSTGQRLQACKPWLDAADQFALTYSDTLSDVNLAAELQFHLSQGRVATLVSTQPPVRFRVLGIRQGESLVRAFAPRPVIENASINGGYYLFSRKVWAPEFAIAGELPLEDQPLERLAKSEQLAAFAHRGDWHYCDGDRDLAPLSAIAQKIEALHPGKA